MLEILIIAVLFILNVFFLFYCKFLLNSLASLAESVKDMSVIFDGFKKHVEGLHETEMFYGEPTLQNLIEHSKFVVEKIEENSEIVELMTQEDTDAPQTLQEE